jgi:2-polyprenyl-6-methoxyphenol hydroxylase-like FAD-dependent oxidoreductase
MRNDHRTNEDCPVVAIAGGGIGGLACALALARSGVRSRVLEQASHFGEVGVGLQVAPNAVAALRALGVQEAERQSLQITGFRLVDAISSETLAHIDLGEHFERRFGNPYLVAHRADIHGALCRACEANELIDLRTDSTVTGFEICGSEVSVTLASGITVNASALVGADGVSSRVRSLIVRNDNPMLDAGVIYRALIPAAEMPLEEQKSFITLWAGPGWHVIYYPIRDRSAYNFAAVATDPGLIRRGNGEASVDEVLEAVRPGEGILRTLLAIPNSFRRYVIRYRDPIDNWTMGPVTLLGDAAHPMVHYLAQGAAMALEDAMCLGQVVASGDGDFARAFQLYQTLRITRSARVQISALMLDHLLHSSGVERLVRNSILEGRNDELYYDRFAWLYTSPTVGQDRRNDAEQCELQVRPSDCDPLIPRRTL